MLSLARPPASAADHHARAPFASSSEFVRSFPRNRKRGAMHRAWRFRDAVCHTSTSPTSILRTSDAPNPETHLPLSPDPTLRESNVPISQNILRHFITSLSSQHDSWIADNIWTGHFRFYGQKSVSSLSIRQCAGSKDPARLDRSLTQSEAVAKAASRRDSLTLITKYGRNILDR